MTSIPTPQKINLDAAFASIAEPWQPRVAGTVNDTQIRLARLEGEFVWHHHEHQDEMFLVIQGRLVLKFRDGEAMLTAGEFIVVPRGVEHCPIGCDDCKVMLIEPASTLNTGNIENERTVRTLQTVG